MNIKEYFKHTRTTQEEFSNMSGISRSTIQRLASGGTVKVETAEQIERATLGLVTKEEVIWPDLYKQQKEKFVYRMFINEHQLSVMKRALELFARIERGQWSEVSRCCSRVDVNDYAEVNELLEALAYKFGATQERDKPVSIMSPEVHINAKVASDLSEVLRHRIAWDRDPEGSLRLEHPRPAHCLKDMEPARVDRLK